jgi:hypothetical protein
MGIAVLQKMAPLDVRADKQQDRTPAVSREPASDLVPSSMLDYADSAQCSAVLREQLAAWRDSARASCAGVQAVASRVTTDGLAASPG